MHIGLSLSFCVRDILDGVVLIDTVHAIVSNTAFSPEGFATEALESYYNPYWNKSHSPSHVLEVLEQLKDRVVQPKHFLPDPGHTVCRGHWLVLPQQPWDPDVPEHCLPHYWSPR
jgi:hypothetical protein